MRPLVVVGLALGVLMLLAGLLITAQGLGYAGAGPARSLAFVGPLVAGLGVALVISIGGRLRR